MMRNGWTSGFIVGRNGLAANYGGCLPWRAVEVRRQAGGGRLSDGVADRVAICGHIERTAFQGAAYSWGIRGFCGFQPRIWSTK